MSAKRTFTKRITTAAAVGAAAWLVASCADKVAGPDPQIGVPFAISDEQRSALSTAVRYATRNESVAALAHREGAAQIVAAFARLSDRIAENDRVGARRAIEMARSALDSYRHRAPSDLAGLLEVELMSLALYNAELLAGDTPAPALYLEVPSTSS